MEIHKQTNIKFLVIYYVEKNFKNVTTNKVP